MKHIIISLFLLGFAACGHVNFEPPEGFIELRKSDTVLRLVASDASALRVTYRENKKNGTTQFWAEIFKRELTEFKGYKLVKEEPFREKAGVIFELLAPFNNSEFHYTVAVLTNEDDVYVIELGAEKAVYDKHRKAFLDLVTTIYKDEIK
ncbi:hypothetical protein KKD52_07010 [Myxococcota bacterium]|nr:hypothetical protein [Myxococcota bacterium]MBU1243051.1 hypothetical protein [Myxococcota bacterium]MBU1410800.1 hypothetical protein [Myxococcota bacterium]MBU1510095.1 hypothetical protein [Myxococcota bacterium]